MGWFDFLKSKPDPAVMKMRPGEVAADVLNTFTEQAEQSIQPFVNQITATAKRYGIHPGYLWYVLADHTERGDWPDMARRQKVMLNTAIDLAIMAQKGLTANRLAVPDYEDMDKVDKAIMAMAVWVQEHLPDILLKKYRAVIAQKTKKYQSYVLNFAQEEGIDEDDPGVLLSTLSTVMLQQQPFYFYGRNVLPFIFGDIFELY